MVADCATDKILRIDRNIKKGRCTFDSYALSKVIEGSKKNLEKLEHHLKRIKAEEKGEEVPEEELEG